MATEEEEEYFHRLQAEQRAKLRKQLDEQAAELAAQQAKADLSERIRRLGFSGDAARIFDLLPLVHVAWADGRIQRSERTAIFKVLESRGIARDSEAHAMMAALLEVKPSQAYLDESLAVLRDAVGGQRARSIVDLCLAVAEASGTFLGIGKAMSDDERELIERIAGELGEPARAELERRLETS